MEELIENELHKKQRLVADHTDIVIVLDEVESWLRLIIMRLISSLPRSEFVNIDSLSIEGVFRLL